MRCDAEIGKPGNWHGCKRSKITVTVVTVHGAVLHYCAKHEGRVDDAARKHHGPLASVAYVDPSKQHLNR